MLVAAQGKVLTMGWYVSTLQPRKVARLHVQPGGTTYQLETLFRIKFPQTLCCYGYLDMW